MRIRERPQRGLKTDRADGTSQLACPLEAISIDQRNVSPHVCIFGYIPVEVLTDLDLKAFILDVIQELFSLLVFGINDSHNLEQLMELNRSGRRFDVAGDHGSVPCALRLAR